MTPKPNETPETPQPPQEQQPKPEKQFSVKESVLTGQLANLEAQLQQLQNEYLKGEKIHAQIGANLQENQAKQQFTIGSIQALKSLIEIQEAK